MNASLGLFSAGVVEHLNAALTVDLDQEDESIRYSSALLTRYRSSGRPLSGNLIICGLLECYSTILAQALAQGGSKNDTSNSVGPVAANAAWDALLNAPVMNALTLSDGVRESLRWSSSTALQCFTDIIGFAQAMIGDSHADSYAFEILSESLVSRLTDAVVPQH